MAVDVQHAVEDDVAELNVTINTTPLVDVMLVMLIIFLVTIPVILKTVPVQLPTYRNIVTVTNVVVATPPPPPAPMPAGYNPYFDLHRPDDPRGPFPAMREAEDQRPTQHEAGHPSRLRTLRHACHQEESGSVVLPHHEVRR